MPFRIALSGLDAASTDLQVTGHNIANAATNGFKQSRAEFADIYANSIQDVSTTSAGRGVRVSRVAQQFSQGNVDFTANNLDLALNGEGFFTLKGANGDTSYTRAGAYTVDRNGYVVNHTNDRLQVFSPIGNTGNFNTGATTDLQLPTLSGQPNATESVTAALNLSASEGVPSVGFDTTSTSPDPESYNHSTSTTVYDSLGAAHTMTMYYVKQAESATVDPGTWHAYTYIDDTLVPYTPTSAPVTLVFDASGKLDPSSSNVDPQGQVTLNPWEDDLGSDGLLSNGAAALNITFNYNNTTQFGSAFEVNNLTQNGYAPGRLSGIDIDNTGVVSARFTNGQSSALGKVALAKFNNPQGLRQQGDTSWVETYTSGNVQMGEAGTSSFGLVQSGALENSNVDIAEQLVNLITAQRNYQANAQVITTADTVTQTIINIR